MAVEATSVWLWAGFLAFVLAMLALDLGVFQRKAHAVFMREAATWSVVWIGLALCFNALIYLWQGWEPALAVILGFVGLKMLLADIYEIPIELSLAVIAGVLALAILASLLRSRGAAQDREVTAEAGGSDG